MTTFTQSCIAIVICHWESKLESMDIIGTIIHKCVNSSLNFGNVKWNAGIWSENYLFHWTFQLSHNVNSAPLKLGANVKYDYDPVIKSQWARIYCQWVQPREAGLKVLIRFIEIAISLTSCIWVLTAQLR